MKSNPLVVTIVGVCLAAMLAFISWGVSDILKSTSQHSIHLSRIDAVLESNKDILSKVSAQAGSIPEGVEHKLSELRARLNIQEERMNSMSNRINSLEQKGPRQ